MAINQHRYSTAVSGECISVETSMADRELERFRNRLWVIVCERERLLGSLPSTPSLEHFLALAPAERSHVLSRCGICDLQQAGFCLSSSYTALCSKPVEDNVSPGG